MFGHLEALTWSFRADGRRVYAIHVYSEPQTTEHGVEYRPRIAAESGMEGVSCVDDVARAALLASLAYEQTGDRHTAELAQRWLTFVHYMQLDDGRFTNFILDQEGTRNLDGRTSYPGGAWWTARALWALAAAYRVLGNNDALTALTRCPLPSPEYPGELKTRAVLALAGLELLRSPVPAPVKALWKRRVRRWCDAMVDAGREMPYIPDATHVLPVGLWGYHQLLALASAGTVLRDGSYLAAAERSVEGLVHPVLAGNFYYRFPDQRDNQCAYCVSPLVQGLAQLYRATGKETYRQLGLRAAEWFAGANDAAAIMYDTTTGRCFDGVSGQWSSANCGAESAIEAGFAELERRWLAAHTGTPSAKSLVS